jgi:DNA-binding transcriptional LysR family regulator
LSIEELAKLVTTRLAIGRPEGSAVQDVCREYFKSQDLLSQINDKQFVVKSLEGSMRAVAAGIGITIVPRGTIEEILPHAIKDIRLPPAKARTRHFYVAWRKGHVLSATARELLGILGAKSRVI